MNRQNRYHCLPEAGGTTFVKLFQDYVTSIDASGTGFEGGATSFGKMVSHASRDCCKCYTSAANHLFYIVHEAAGCLLYIMYEAARPVTCLHVTRCAFYLFFGTPRRSRRPV